MSLSNYQLPVASDPTVDFLEALATNEISADVNLVLPTRDSLWFIRAISIVCLQNLAWEVQLFTKAANLGGTFDTDNFLGVWQFGVLVPGPPASPGYPVTEVGASPADPYFHQYIDGNMMPYYDLDQMERRNNPGTGPTNNAHLHVRLVNRSAASKIAGASGALKVTFYCALQGLMV